MIDRSVGEALFSMIKWGAISLAVLAPLGLWKAAELIAAVIS